MKRSLFQLTKFNLDNNSKLLHATALQNYSRLFVHLDDIADIDVHLDDIDDILRKKWSGSTRELSLQVYGGGKQLLNTK